jgi:hypothetical protein
MNKKDYQLFAEVISRIVDINTREAFITFLVPIFKRDNFRFNEDRFREFIKRRVNNESLKGLNCNPKYLYA